MTALIGLTKAQGAGRREISRSQLTFQRPSIFGFTKMEAAQMQLYSGTLITPVLWMFLLLPSGAHTL